MRTTRLGPVFSVPGSFVSKGTPARRPVFDTAIRSWTIFLVLLPVEAKYRGLRHHLLPMADRFVDVRNSGTVSEDAKKEIFCHHDRCHF